MNKKSRPPEKRLLTVTEYAEKKNVPARTVRGWANDGLLIPQAERDRWGRFFVDSVAVRVANKPTGGKRAGAGRPSGGKGPKTAQD